MNYRIEGGSLPVVIISLNPGEAVNCESGAMSWMTAGIKMSTSTGGGIGKMFGRMVTGESAMLNTYTAEQAGEIAFASSFPGSIKVVELNGNSVVSLRILRRSHAHLRSSETAAQNDSCSTHHQQIHLIHFAVSLSLIFSTQYGVNFDIKFHARTKAFSGRR